MNMRMGFFTLKNANIYVTWLSANMDIDGTKQKCRYNQTVTQRSMQRVPQINQRFGVIVNRVLS